MAGAARPTGLRIDGGLRLNPKPEDGGGVLISACPRPGAGTPGVVPLDCNTLQQSDCENVHL